MKTSAPVNIGNLGKAFFIALLLLTATWLAVSYLFFQEIYVVRPILVANLILAAILGWFYYKYRYHAVFSYGREGFQLRQGQRTEIRHRWEQFKHLSLAHLGAGRMAIRLYLKEVPQGEDAVEFVEIPATDLLLDAFALRDEVSVYIGGSARQKKTSEVSGDDIAPASEV